MRQSRQVPAGLVEYCPPPHLTAFLCWVDPKVWGEVLGQAGPCQRHPAPGGPPQPVLDPELRSSRTA